MRQLNGSGFWHYWSGDREGCTIPTARVEPRLATRDQRLDAIVSVVVAAIYGTPAGPVGVAA